MSDGRAHLVEDAYLAWLLLAFDVLRHLDLAVVDYEEGVALWNAL